MKLQRQLENLNWINVEPNHTDYFINMAIEFQETTREQLIVRMAHPTRDEFIDGFRYGSEWYQKLRDADAQDPRNPTPADMVRCDCGHTVERVHAMSASMGTACPACYARMDD